MEDFSLDDLEQHTVEVKKIELLGKRAYLRKLTFDGQIFIGQRFSGKEESEASAEDMRLMVACLLCDSAGNLLFDDFEHGAKLLAKLDSDELLLLIDQANDLNGQNVESEKKVSSLVR